MDGRWLFLLSNCTDMRTFIYRFALPVNHYFPLHSVFLSYLPFLPYPLLTFSPHPFSSFLPNLTISHFLWTSLFLCPSFQHFFSFSPKPWGPMVSLLPAFQRRHLRRAVTWKLAKKNSVILTMKKRMRWDSLII